MGKSKVGNKNHLGKPHSEETKRKISISRTGKYGGSLAPRWNETSLLSLVHKELAAGRKKPKECEICGKTGRICFDHDHKTGKFRGWICHRCNVTLGMVADSPELLILLASFLNKP